MSQQERAAAKARQLRARYDRLSGILDSLYRERDLEVRSEEKQRLDYRIAEREKERQEVEAQLQTLESSRQTTPTVQQSVTSPSSVPVASESVLNHKPITIFYSYAHKDEALREQLEKHLKILQRQGIISDWHDRAIAAGAEWEKEIDSHLEAANIILLLISADFIASDYCWGKELTRAMERHDAQQARVIPIILREVDWTGAPFSKLQALPKDAKPVTTWPSQDAAFTDIARGIRQVALELAKRG
jgi:hypothetical protein